MVILKNSILEEGEYMGTVKCPYFLSKTNGKNLYINCSAEKFINDESLRKEFVCKEARKVCYELNCCSEFVLCQNYVTLNKAHTLADNEKLLKSDFMKQVESMIIKWDKALNESDMIRSHACLQSWELVQAALKFITSIEWHFTRTDRYYGICTEDEKFLLVKWRL